MRFTTRSTTRLLAIAVVTTLGVMAASPAQAAPPANDTFDGAVPIGTIPFTTTQDVTEATTDATDEEANDACGAPALDASVWYSVTSTTDRVLLVDVGQSSYPAGVLVVTGAPGSFDVVTCGPSAVAFEATAGVTYYLLIIDDQSDGGRNGGILVLTVDEAPPPPELSLTVDPRATFDPRTGAATVSGTMSCVGVVDIAYVQVELRQSVGRGEVYGYGSIEITCDGTATAWSVEIYPVLGTKFAGGKAATLTFAVACGPVFCSFDYQEHRVHLSRR